ncbi:TPA: cytochrome P450 [Stenotrophomonas maltophilia]
MTRLIRAFFQHHSPDFWEAPDRFDPDCGLPERRRSSKGACVPFGFSSRACVVSAVGHAQLLLFCALVTRDFELQVQAHFAYPVDFVGRLIPRG